MSEVLRKALSQIVLTFGIFNSEITPISEKASFQICSTFGKSIFVKPRLYWKASSHINLTFENFISFNFPYLKAWFHIISTLGASTFSISYGWKASFHISKTSFCFIFLGIVISFLALPGLNQVITIFLSNSS